MQIYEFEVYVEGDLEVFECNCNLFDDGMLGITSSNMTIMFNREASSIGAAIDSVIENVKSCGGKVLYIDLTPDAKLLRKV